MIFIQGMEDNNLIDPVQKLGAEGAPQLFNNPFLHRLIIQGIFFISGLKAHTVLAADQVRPYIRCHDDHGIPEIHGPALGISKPSVLHHLQQDMEDIRVCLFDLIKEHNRVRALPDSLCQLAGLLIAHISWGRSQKPGHSVLLHVFGHIEPHHGLFITEKRLC